LPEKRGKRRFIEMDLYVRRKVTKYRGSSKIEVQDPVAVEKKLRITSEGKDIISLSCTPSMIKELVAGFLLSENIVSDADSLSVVHIDYGEEISVALPSNAVNGQPDIYRYLGGISASSKRTKKLIHQNLCLSVESLKRIFREFQDKANLFRLTGCFHSAALSNEKQILAFTEDIGRHNAVDKVIGYALLNSIPLKGMIMLVSCRISSDIVSRCLRWDIPIIASKAAATDLSVQIAEEAGITLIGFVRGDNMNIYTHPQRIHP
jgi:FdhD protein